MTWGNAELVREETQRREWSLWAGWTRYVAWVLLVLSVALLVWTLVFGQRAATLSELENAVATGSTTHVRVTPGLEPGARGHATVQVQWRTRLFSHTTAVVEASPRGKGRAAAQEDGVTGLIGQDLRTHLTAINPDVEVEEVGYSYGPAANWLWWRISGWPVVVLIFTWLFTFTLMVSGPDPWRATKWAWFWLMISVLGPVALIVYLVVGGPTGLAPAPRRGARRLTGGWAFLVMVLANAVVVTPYV
jgi:hypothetical protein